MQLDARIRRSILRALARDKDALVDGSQLAEELGVDADLLEAYADVMDEEGQVKVSKYLGGNWDVSITSRGYLEAQTPDDAAKVGAHTSEPAAKGQMAATEARARLEEQLRKVEQLIERASSATLDQLKDWTYWTVAVIERAFGENSKKVWEFRGVSGGVWPFDGESAEAEGYRQRLPEWRRLLRTWLREIDEFETPGNVAKQYIPPRSQFDAYVLLKDTLEEAAGSLVVVDPYVDDSTLKPLLTVKPAVGIRLLTVKAPKDFAHAVERFRQQWGGNIEARQGTKDLHDRFLLVDDRVFLSGASLKDLGQRGSVLIEIQNERAKADIKKDIDRSWQAAQPI
jgi:hypothetical protein